jgi:hypothetical protein
MLSLVYRHLGACQGPLRAYAGTFIDTEFKVKYELKLVFTLT